MKVGSAIVVAIGLGVRGSAGGATSISEEPFGLPAALPGDPILFIGAPALQGGVQEAAAFAWPCLDGGFCGEALGAVEPAREPARIPLPATLVLLGTAMTALALFARRRGGSIG